jgi:TNF receptor-associated protein 1
MMKAMQPESPAAGLARQDFEINPAHPMIVKLEGMRQKDADLAASVSEQILDNARVAAGILEDPRTMLTRLNQLLERVLAKQ